MFLRFKKDKNLVKKSLKIMFFVILSQMLITAVGFLDVFMLSQYRKEDHFASIGMAAEIWFVFQGPTIGFATLFGILYSQYKNNNNFRELLKINVWFSIFLSSLVFILIMTVGSQITKLFFIDNDYNIEQTKNMKILINKYLKIIAIGSIFYTFSIHLINPIIMYGKAKYTLYMSLIGLFANAINNYLFIYVFDYGIVGAGISSSIAYFFQFLFSLFIFWKNRNIFGKITKMFLFDKSVLKTFLKRFFIAISSIIMMWTYAGTSFLITIEYGAKTMQSLSISYSISGILFSILPAISKSVNIIIGEQLGSSKFDNAIEKSKKLIWIVLLVTLAIGLVAVLLAFFVPQNTIRDQKFVNRAKIIILIFSGTLFGFALLTYYSAIFESAGKQFIPAALNYFVPLWLQVTLIIIAGPWVANLNFVNMFLLHNICIYAPAIILVILKRRNTWLVNLNKEKINA